MLHTHNGSFIDEQGRTVLLRGVNLGGSSKVPFSPDGATYRKDGFYNHRDVSFVGRPFPLEEAGEHFSRLKAWGLTFLRFLVTWEAVEHGGPGIYDEAYLDYLQAVVKKAGEYGLTLFIDPHQDVWSRFSGGDGAPGWTFEAAGLDITRLGVTGAAVTHQEHGDPFPRMIWPSNYSRLAAATLFTLFFAGNDFAPRTRVDGVPIQDYLQGHYFAAMQQVAARLRDFPHVIGYDTLNEPGDGYIGCANLANRTDGLMRKGPMPTTYQSMLLAAGMPQNVEVWEFGATGARKVGKQVVNAEGVSAWLPGCADIWREHGVWDLDAAGQPRLLRPDYFRRVGNRVVDFNRDYLKPFANRYAAAIRAVHPGVLIFLETTPNHHDLPQWGPEDAEGVVSAPHWYDGLVLLTKTYHSWLGVNAFRRSPVFGKRAIRASYARQIRGIRRQSAERLCGAPTVVGELGIPFDLQNKQAYRTGQFQTAVEAMDRTLRAMDDALVSYTIWNYTADNTNARGDQWNDEDLSIFSRDQQSNPADLNSGGRALEAVVRPYARATAGEPLRMAFNPHTRVFEFEYRSAGDLSLPTEIFLPAYQVPHGFDVTMTGGRWVWDEPARTLRCYAANPGVVHFVKVRFR